MSELSGAEKMREFRLAVDWSQAELAEHVEISQSMICYMEAGGRRPSLSLAARYLAWVKEEGDRKRIRMADRPTLDDLLELRADEEEEATAVASA